MFVRSFSSYLTPKKEGELEDAGYTDYLLEICCDLKNKKKSQFGIANPLNRTEIVKENNNMNISCFFFMFSKGFLDLKRLLSHDDEKTLYSQYFLKDFFFDGGKEISFDSRFTLTNNLFKRELKMSFLGINIK